MGLQTYIKKRNFKETSEPRSGKAKKEKALKFVVQRHSASHLHYDFRLEMEGVLKSWAVPKGPSMNPKDKRLAMMVEDHPYDYRTFEGIIPAGNYGAGIVEIWDEGTYHAIEEEERKKGEKILLNQLEKGSLKFVIQGKKLKGEFALVKIKGNQKNAWLLIKHKDKFSVSEPYSSEDHVKKNSKIQAPNSKKPNSKKAPNTKSLKPETQSLIPPTIRTKGKKSKMPHNIKPMLAKLSNKAFDSPEWLFEIKWDGYRAIAEVEKGKVIIYSRNNQPFAHKYPSLAKALESINHDVIIDGEIVVTDEKGNPRFQNIQQYRGDKPIYYYLFDILYLDGYDLTSVPLIERKAILKTIVSERSEIKYSDHIEGEGIFLFNEIQKKGWEGIIAKAAQSIYKTGVRSSEWLKIKTQQSQEAIIAGFTAPRGSRKEFGALILGIYEGKKLKYIGHSGGGFTQKSLKEMMTKLKPLIKDKSPFPKKIKTNMPVTWVKPELVCNVSFSEWTADGHMRHPVFQGLREDKKPVEVEKERVIKAPKGKNSFYHTGIDESILVGLGETGDKQVSVNKHKLKLSNVQKIFWPVEKVTKGDVINYYHKVAKLILPYLQDRPESMHRHPHGIIDHGFYHKDIGNSAPSWVKTFRVKSESENKYLNYLVCQDEATLIYMANLGCIEINPWNSRMQSKDFPDYMVIDLDPAPKSKFEDVIEAALAVKNILDKAGAESYCKTSGASGLHVYVPLGAKYDYEQTKEFGHLIAALVSQELPDTTTIERVVKARGNKIYIDFLQNRKGQTLASVYSLRPHAGATVSTPLDWKEVKKGLHPSQFTIYNVFKRFEKKGDLFEGILGKGIDMQKCLKNLR